MKSPTRLFFFLCVVVLLRPAVTCAQQDGSNKDLIASYLHDTLQAAQKIRQLVASAVNSPPGPEHYSLAIEKYEIAFSLAPYAADSFSALAVLYANFSQLLGIEGASNIALDYGKQAYIYQAKTPSAISERSYHYVSNIAGFYLQLNNFDSAIYYYRKAGAMAHSLSNRLWLSSAENNLGCLYVSMKREDSAMYYFRLAEQSLPENGREDSVLEGSIQDNIATGLLKMGNTTDAEALYRKNIALYKVLGVPGKVVQAYLGVISSLRTAGAWTLAREMLGQAEDYVSAQNMRQDYSPRESLLQGWKDFYSASGDQGAALKTADQLMALKDTVSRMNAKQMDLISRSLAETQMQRARTDIQQYQTQVRQARHQARTNFIMALGVGAAALLITVLLLSFFRKRLQLQRAKQELTEVELEREKLEQEKINLELDFKRKDLTDLSVYLGKLKTQHDRINTHISEIRSKRGTEKDEAIRKLASEAGSQAQADEKITHLQENVEQINHAFHAKLKSRFPNLTKSELELCGMIRINMSSKEIGILKNISAESAKMSRYRLRKKLGLKPEDDINRFLEEL